MSISTGTLNLKFMQRGTPLKGSPSGPSTPTPSTPGTPVPAPSSKFIPTDRDSEWQLPASKLKNLRVPAMVSTPSKLKGRITYETSYLPFLERGEASGSSSGRAWDGMEISDEENDEDDEDEEEDNVGSTKMVKGRMVFGQPTKPEKTHFSDEDEEESKEPARVGLRGKGNKTQLPPSTPTTKSKSLRSKPAPNTPAVSSSTPNRSGNQPQTPLPKPNKAGFLRPAGFEDMPSTPNTPSTPTTTATTSKKNKKKRKSTQVDDVPVVETEVKTTAGGKSEHPDVEEEELAQGARKKRRQRKTKGPRDEETKPSAVEPPAVPEPSKGKSKNNKAKKVVEMEEDDDEAEFDDFMDELIGEIERGE